MESAGVFDANCCCTWMKRAWGHMGALVWDSGGEECVSQWCGHGSFVKQQIQDQQIDTVWLVNSTCI